MSVERKQIQHYHTTNSEAIPVASDLLNGEIALNINKGNEKIFIKNSEGNISSFRSEQYYEENFLHKNDTAQSAIDLTGRIEATPEVFTYRPSAGDKSIRDDSAIIKRIKGNTIIWNQQNPDPKLNSSTLRITGKDMGVVNGFRRLESEDGSATLLQMRVASSPYSIKEHIYLVTFRAKTDDSSITFYTNGAFLKDLTMAVSADTIVYGEYITTGRAANYIIPSIKAQNATYLEATDLQIYDLTQMFGAGNEPSTVDEFKALFPNGNYEYNTGEIRSLNVNRIKTTGFNQWDEKWELGVYSESLGVKRPATNTICNVNKIQVFPNTVYNIKHPKATNLLAYIYFYDFDGNYINRKGVNSGTFTTPENCGYINFFMTSAYGVKYNNDICINLSHTNYRNGEYEPYKEFTHELDVIKKYFPDGMKSAGTAYDEITSTKAITRIGVVDLGELSWGISSDGTLLYSTHFGVEINGKRGINVFCPKYDAYSYENAVTKDKTISLQVGYTQSGKTSVMVRDSAYTDAAAFKTAMSGVMLYYELAEPIEVEFDEVVDLTYNVYDFGTEEIFSSVPTAPFKADIVYQFNATDTIRQNKNNINRLSREIDRLNGTKYEINDHQIFLQYYQNMANGIDMYTNKQGYESHNLKVLKRMFQNIDDGGDEVFFVTFNSGNHGSVGGDLHTGVLQLLSNELVIADLPIGILPDVSTNHYILFSDSEVLRSVANEVDGIENLYFRCQHVTLTDKKYVDSIVSNMYITDFTLTNLLSGRRVSISRDFHEAVFANKLILIPEITGGGGYVIPTRSITTDPSVQVQIELFLTSYSNNFLITLFNRSPIGVGRNIAIVPDVKIVPNNTNIVNVTYNELVETRNNSSLIPGMWYRITDYVTTTSQEDTQSAGHQFDVIVLATSENTLSEEARAIKHDGDEYFNTSNLDAWKIWYSLDNDTNRFGWAVSNGKGVIYRMIDEWNNDCPYDFKNIMFKHPNDAVTYTDFYYTFSFLENGVVSDFSHLNINCLNNVIKSYNDIFGSLQFLNAIVFINSDYSMVRNNSFGPNCSRNSFGNGCRENTFDDECSGNTFGDKCFNNTFDNDCYNNTFGDNCYGNTFGENCDSNTFGEGCASNTFGKYCSNITFGNYCSCNVFGDHCSTISFRTSASENAKLKDYCQYNHFAGKCSYTVVWNDTTTDNVNHLQNVNIKKGISGVHTEHKMINITTLNADYEINVAKNSNGEIKIYCEADLNS